MTKSRSNVPIPAAASKLLTQTKSVPTPKNEYAQYLKFWPYKLVSLLAWGYSDSIERLPDYNYIVHLPSWATEMGTTSQRIRESLVDAHDLGLIENLSLRRAHATVRLPPIIKEEDNV